MLLLTKQHDSAIAELEQAVSLNPNFSWAYAMLASALNWSGRPDEAIGPGKKAMRLDPKCEAWVTFPLGDSYYWLRRYDDAIPALQDAVRRNPSLHIFARQFDSQMRSNVKPRRPGAGVVETEERALETKA